jgi:hypothetical protein
MFGIEDPVIYIGYLLAIASSLLCVVYGLLNWNKDGEKPEEVSKDLEWEEKEEEINAQLNP